MISIIKSEKLGESKNMHGRILRQNIFILLISIFMGGIYYKFSTSKEKELRDIAFMIKMLLLIISFLLAFARQDFIIIGDIALGGRMPVMVLVLLEIADAFIDRKNNFARLNKRKKHNSGSGMKMRKK